MWKVVVFVLIIVTCVCAVMYPTLSGVDLGNKVVGNNSIVTSTLNTIKPLVDTAKFLYNCVKWLVDGVVGIWRGIVKFFGGKVELTPEELAQWKERHPNHEWDTPCPENCPYRPSGGGGGGSW